MDISYYKKYEPVDGKWYFNKELGSGAFGKVFEIERRDFTNDKSALKIITIPSSPSEVSNYREENYDLDEKSITSYFYGFVEEFIKEFQLMTKLKGNSNIVSIEDYDVKQHDDEIGWDILIRMELLTPMNKYFAQTPPTIRDVIKLGIDICKALEVCQKFNIVHRDIKPSNIFVSEAGEYKLGDFGVARTLEKTSSGLSKKGTYTYMAPEVYKGEAYSSNVDIYSLGIVMYKLLNNNMEPYKQGRTHEDEENALIARLKGEPMPKPANADGRLAEIILKACAFEPKDRYESPLQMRNELESILYSEKEEKIIYPEGENLDYEPSKGSINEEPVTSGVFDKTPKNDIPQEDELTKGIFDVVENVKTEEKKIEVQEEYIDDNNENNYECKRELSWKGILVICSVILIIIIAAIWGFTSNKSLPSDTELCAVQNNGKWGFVDANNSLVIPYMYDDIWTTFEYGNNLAAVKKGNKWGFIDKNNKTVIPFIYDATYGFDEGLAPVLKMQDSGEGGWGFINEKGDIVVPFIYEDVGRVFEGMALISKNSKYGYINNKGEIVIEPKYDDASYFECGVAFVQKNNKYALINKDEEFLSDYIYDAHWNMIEDMTMVVKDGQWGVINNEGETILPFGKYESSDYFTDGIAAVCKKGRWGFVNTNDETIIPFEYDEAQSFCNGSAPVKKNGKWGFINLSGQYITDNEFDDVAGSTYVNGKSVKKGDKWGFISYKGEILLDFISDEEIYEADEGKYGVTINGEDFTVDENGNKI